MKKTIIKDNGTFPRAIALNPAEGFMFFSNRNGSNSSIVLCHMDGSKREIIVKEDISNPYSLAIDLASRRIFWVDFDKKYLSSAKFDGHYRKNLITQLKNPMSLDVYGQYVYLVQFAGGFEGVYKASKLDGSGLTKLFDGERSLLTLKILDRSKQLEGFNVCGTNNGGCSHLCLPTSGHTFSCACPDGRNMSSDKFTCLNEDGSVATTTTLATTSTTSQVPFTVFQSNFTGSISTGSVATITSVAPTSTPSQAPSTVFQSNCNGSDSTGSAVATTSSLATTSSTSQVPDKVYYYTPEDGPEATTSLNMGKSDTFIEGDGKNNVDTTSGSSGIQGTLTVVMASLALLIALVALIIIVFKKRTTEERTPTPHHRNEGSRSSTAMATFSIRHYDNVLTPSGVTENLLTHSTGPATVVSTEGNCGISTASSSREVTDTKCTDTAATTTASSAKENFYEVC